MVDLSLKAQFQAAQHLARQGELQEAAALCRRILGAFPRHAHTYAVLGQTYLALGEHEEAANLFRRVLSADPEHTLAYASLGAIYAERSLLDEAAWQMERAFELSPGNREIRAELRALYLQRGASVERVKPTRGALARIYLRGQLYPKAIGELRELVSAQPHRMDLRVALAEALWHDRRYADVEVVCQGILAELPNCLKANLILGQLWLNTPQDDRARALLQRAQMIDPDNTVAQALFGENSALPPRASRLPFEEGDAPAPNLPYLLDEDDVVDADPSERPARRWAPTPEPELAAEPAPTPQPQPVPDPQPAPEPEPEDYLEAEERALAARPDDTAARLRFARHCRNVGALPRALTHYARLIERHPQALEAVANDLARLSRRYPADARVAELLAQARVWLAAAARPPMEPTQEA